VRPCAGLAAAARSGAGVSLCNGSRFRQDVPYHAGMILVSCRHGFDSNEFFDELQIRRYPSLSRLDVFEILADADLAAHVANRHVLVLVHGYRNPLPAVANAYRRLETELRRRGLLGPGKYDEVLGFLWPGFQTVVGFFAAVPWANRAAAYFRSLVAMLNSSAHTVDVQTHSLGARTALQAMAFPAEIWVDNLMLTAAAVDNEVLEPGEEFNQSLLSCRRCIVYHSSNDPVLKIAYRIGAFDKALGYRGPQDPDVIEAECPDVFVVDASAVVKSHGGYRAASAIYAHWQRILAEAPLERFETLRNRR
jgi:esterase/lipase superfamily enzyme